RGGGRPAVRGGQRGALDRGRPRERPQVREPEGPPQVRVHRAGAGPPGTHAGAVDAGGDGVPLGRGQGHRKKINRGLTGTGLAAPAGVTRSIFGLLAVLPLAAVAATTAYTDTGTVAYVQATIMPPNPAAGTFGFVTASGRSRTARATGAALASLRNLRP